MKSTRAEPERPGRAGEGQGAGMFSRGLTALAALLLVAACEREFILEGERLDPRALSLAGPVEVPENRSAAISLPAPVANPDWTHRGGSVTGTAPHSALSSVLQPLWSADIGEGDSRRFRITAEPVAAGGRIFTLDARATVTATGTDGSTLWQTGLRPDWAGRGTASGGGLAVADGRVFATSAYGRLVALDAATGAEVWSHRFEAPVTAAPTVLGGQVYVVSSDSVAWVLDAATGRVAWQKAGTPSPSAMVGGPAPAVTDRAVLLPYPSGDLTAALRETGLRLWTTRVAGRRTGIASAFVTDIAGDPVVVGSTVYVGNRSGRVMAIDVDTGTARWTARDGALAPLRVVAGNVFFVSDTGALVRVDAATGERIWAVDLGHYIDERERRRSEVVAHHGPLLAGGRVVVASNDGLIRLFDPVDGSLVGQVEVPRGATANPIVVNGTLYVVSTDGRLHAFR